MRVSRRIAAYSKPIGLLIIIALIFHFSSEADPVKVVSAKFIQGLKPLSDEIIKTKSKQA